MEKIVKEFYVYTFDELEEDVKKRLIAKEREYMQTNYVDFQLSDDMGSKASDLLNDYFGITSDYLKTYYSLCYCQGDGAMIEFDISIEDINNKYKVFSDEEMRFLIDKSVVSKIIIKHNNSHYYHEYTFEIDSDYYNYWNYDEIKDNYNIKEEDFNTINSRFYKLVDNSIRNCRDNKFAWDIVNMNSELGRYGYECIEYFGNCSEEEIINSIREQDLMFLENGDVYNG